MSLSFSRDWVAFTFSGKVFPNDFDSGIMPQADSENGQKEAAMDPSCS